MSNARLYDPVLGRFISADTFVQSPLNLQSYNRYSYVWNNPLSFTDPTGHFLSSKQRHWFKKNRNQILTTAVTIAFTAANPIAGGAIGGAFGATINGGSGQDIFIAAFRGGGTAAISASIFDGIGNAYANETINIYEKVIYHGLAGGYMAAIQGGDIQAGFVAALVTESANASGLTDFIARDTYVGNVVASALIGGTVSEINGGTFANGAITAAFQTMFNHLAHKSGGHKRYQRRQARLNDGEGELPTEADLLAAGGYSALGAEALTAYLEVDKAVKLAKAAGVGFTSATVFSDTIMFFNGDMGTSVYTYNTSKNISLAALSTVSIPAAISAGAAVYAAEQLYTMQSQLRHQWNSHSSDYRSRSILHSITHGPSVYGLSR